MYNIQFNTLKAEVSSHFYIVGIGWLPDFLKSLLKHCISETQESAAWWRGGSTGAEWTRWDWWEWSGRSRPDQAVRARGPGTRAPMFWGCGGSRKRVLNRRLCDLIFFFLITKEISQNNRRHDSTTKPSHISSQRLTFCSFCCISSPLF